MKQGEEEMERQYQQHMQDMQLLKNQGCVLLSLTHQLRTSLTCFAFPITEAPNKCARCSAASRSTTLSQASSPSLLGVCLCLFSRNHCVLSFVCCFHQSSARRRPSHDSPCQPCGHQYGKMHAFSCVSLHCISPSHRWSGSASGWAVYATLFLCLLI
jgi:hypothetical protein